MALLSGSKLVRKTQTLLVGFLCAFSLAPTAPGYFPGERGAERPISSIATSAPAAAGTRAPYDKLERAASAGDPAAAHQSPIAPSERDGGAAAAVDLRAEVGDVPQVPRESAAEASASWTAKQVFLGMSIVFAALVLVLFVHRVRTLRRMNERLRRSLDERERARLVLDQFRSALDSSGSVILLVDVTRACFLDLNSTACSVLGYPREELLELCPGKVWDGWSPARLPLLVQEMTTHGGKVCETELLRKDGSRVPLELMMNVANRSGMTVLVAGGRDISERKRAETERRRLAAAVEQASESIYITDLQGAVVYANAACAATSGYTVEELMRSGPEILRSGLHDAVFFEEIRQTVLSGRAWRGRITSRKKSGDLYTEEVAVAPVRNAQGDMEHYVCVKRDVTREMEIEMQIRQSQKLDAVGRLAGGIAHDFNNLLAAVIGYTEYSMQELAQDNPIQEHLALVLHAAYRGRDLVRQILMFSRHSEQAREPVAMDVLVRETLKLLRVTLPANIHVDCDVGPNLYVLGDPAQLHQVILNLCINAQQAMRQGGALRVSLEPIGADEALPAVLHSKPYGSYLRLTVADTGEGMDEQVSERVFEPFFTTKSSGEGPGLGLSTVHGIVQSHGGAVTVTSAPGRGSDFCVYLPRLQGAEEAVDAVLLSAAFGNGERLMLVDDEDFVLDAERRILEQLGYRVDAFQDSMEAWSAFELNPHAFSLVITDHYMPALSGLDLSARIHELRPDLPVLLLTGYSDGAASQAIGKAGIAQVVTKPVMAREFSHIVRRHLASTTVTSATPQTQLAS